jgi:hypothetical protein
MVESITRVAIDSLISREGNTKKNASELLVKNSSKKEEDKETLHADPTFVGTAESLAEGNSFVPKQVSRSLTLPEARRYKNPILAIFSVMSIARRTMQDVAKSSKEQTRLVKKHWEQVSHEVSGHHDTAAKQSDKIQKWSGVIGMACTFGPKFLKGCIPSEGEFKEWRDEQSKFLETYDPIFFLKNKLGYEDVNFYSGDWEKSLENTFEDRKGTLDWINRGGENAQKFAEPSIQQWGQQVQMENARDTTVGQQNSQAAQADYQSRKDEKSQEDQIVSNIEQTLQRLMEQESRTFELRG